MEKRPIQILVVDDSRVSRELLVHIIESDSQLRVMGIAEDGIQALHWLETHTPDVITMDVRMPNIDGFEVTRRIIETKPIPIVIITSAYNSKNADMAFHAIEAGALAILEKPVGFGDKNYHSQVEEIIKTIKTIAEVKLIKKRVEVRPPDVFIPPIPEQYLKEEFKAVAIGASLGGPPAIAEILSQLPLFFPVPIFIVQHIAAGFIHQFHVWLQERCRLPIQLARNGEKGMAGHIYLAPDHCHMRIKKGDIISLHSSSNPGPQPSVSHLFASMAETYGSHGIGIILTGMGKDGAEELLLMKQKGAYTIAQSKESCIMFGMPREAIAIGGARQVLALEKIAPVLIKLVMHDSHLPQNGKIKP